MWQVSSWLMRDVSSCSIQVRIGCAIPLTSLFVGRNPVLGFIVNAMEKRVIKILFKSHPLIEISELEAAKEIRTCPVMSIMSMMSISTLCQSDECDAPHTLQLQTRPY